MLRDHYSPDASAAKIIGVEVVAHAASLMLYPFGLGHSRAKTPRVRDQRTVVFIHGYLGNRSAFLPLKAYLRALGISRTLSFHYRPGASVEQSASELQKFLRKHIRGGRIDLVCHSLGGIIARVYLQQLNGARRVDRCITLGTPHHGTYSAYWLPTRVARALRPDSPLFVRLNEYRLSASRVAFTYIVAASDNIVVPRIFAHDGDDVVVIDQIGHLGILFSPKAFRTVADRLRAKVGTPANTTGDKMSHPAA